MKRLTRRLFLLLAGCGLLCNASAFGANDPFLISYDYQDLVQIRQQIKASEATHLEAYKKLLREADKLLKLPAEKVTDGDAPPSGDKHDFFAIGKLAFPNPNTPNGLPYVRRDGVTNPEADGDRYDLKRYNLTISRVNELSLAWFYSGDEKYAAKASELLRVWFLNPETRMNPNLKNASALPGVQDGMPIGIIFGVALIKMVDHVKLLAESKSWTNEDNDKLKKWFSDFNNWLLTSELGIKESKGKNNHGSWYTAQVMAYALYSGDTQLPRSLMELARKQLDMQIKPDGSMPLEIARQRSLHYSLYGLQAFTYVARCAEYLGEDLWNYTTKDGRGLKLAFDFLVPYLQKEKEWPWKDIEKGKSLGSAAVEVVRWGAKKYQTPAFIKATAFLTEATSESAPKVWLTGLNPVAKR